MSAAAAGAASASSAAAPSTIVFMTIPVSFKIDTLETTWRELGCFAVMPER
jgi:predicted dinucleotide-binding enzyme